MGQSSHGDDADETRHVVDEEGSVDSSAKQQQHVLDDVSFVLPFSVGPSHCVLVARSLHS